MTLRYPKAFRDGLPADYDGLFYWEYIDHVLVPIRGIQLSDIDAVSQINRNFLTFDTSEFMKPDWDDPAAKKSGQTRTIDHLLMMAQATNGLYTFSHLDIVGKKIPRQWRWRGVTETGNLWMDDWQSAVDGREIIAPRVERWAKWSNERL